MTFKDIRKKSSKPFNKSVCQKFIRIYFILLSFWLRLRISHALCIFHSYRSEFFCVTSSLLLVRHNILDQELTSGAIPEHRDRFWRITAIQTTFPNQNILVTTKLSSTEMNSAWKIMVSCYTPSHIAKGFFSCDHDKHGIMEYNTHRHFLTEINHIKKEFLKKLI